MADTGDLKSPAPKVRAGSNPASGMAAAGLLFGLLLLSVPLSGAGQEFDNYGQYGNYGHYSVESTQVEIMRQELTRKLDEIAASLDRINRTLDLLKRKVDELDQRIK